MNDPNPLPAEEEEEEAAAAPPPADAAGAAAGAAANDAAVVVHDERALAALAAAERLASTLRLQVETEIRFEARDGTFDRLWTAAEHRVVMAAAQNNTSIRSVAVNVTDMSTLKAKGVACLVGQLPKVDTIEILSSYRLIGSCELVRDVADAFLRGIEEEFDTTAATTRTLKTLKLFVHCSPDVLLDFVDRFPGITSLEVAGNCYLCRGNPCTGHGNFAASFADVAVRRLPNLREFRLRCDEPSTAVLGLLHSLNASESVRELGVSIVSGRSDFLRGVSLFCSLVTSLNKITFSSCTETPVNISDVLERPFSPSIAELQFRLCSVDPVLDSLEKALVAMQHVEVLRFAKCRIAVAFGMLGSLPRLKKISVISRSSFCDADHSLEDEYDEQPYMLGTNNDLERLCRVVERCSLEEVVLDVVGQTGTGNRIDGRLPAVARLLRESRGALTLNVGKLPRQSSAYVAEGIRGVRDDLKELRIRCFRCKFGDRDYAEFLRPLAVNKTLAAFELGFDPSADLGALDLSIASIRDVLLANTTLNALSFRGLHPGLEASVLAAVVPVLTATNRSLRVLQFRDLDMTQPFVFRTIPAVLKQNDVLYGIGTLFQSPLDDPRVKQIEFLLKQNRYGRRFVLRPNLVVARGIWATVLGRVSAANETSVMYKFLRAKPDLLSPPHED